MRTRRVYILVGVVGFYFSVLFFVSCQTNNTVEKQIVFQDTVPLSKHWESPIPHQEIPEGLSSISASSCGVCHQEIYEEWKESTHAIAFQDLQFQEELKKDNILTCLNCHTPLQNQQEFIVNGIINGDYKTPAKVPNPHFDKALQQESITCASCHVRSGKIIGTMGITDAPHETVKDVDFLSESLCTSCHNVVDELNPVLVCTFETGDEWEKGWAIEEGKTCISCHMPEVERSIFPGIENRKAHKHHFPGSGIPKFPEMEVERLEGLEITESEIQESYSIEDSLHYILTLENKYAGHSVPTGDPERYIIVSFKLKDEQGDIIKEEKHRIGEKWQWYPVAEKLADNNLRLLEERSYSFSYYGQKIKKLKLIVEITKHRMTEENAAHHQLLGKYPLSIEVFKKEYVIQME